MIDFHTHMLPGIDDGAGFFSDSLQMARMALKDGVRGVVLTPPTTGEGTITAGKRYWPIPRR